MKLTGALLATLCATGMADVYMHNPRGSNDRNCERNVNRNNGNRMFDSQNNAKGGYACPRRVSSGDEQDQTPQMYYLTGSVLPIEWTAQHGCGGDSKVNCEVVLQYACEDTLDPATAAAREASNFIAATRTDTERPFRTTANVAAPRDGAPRDTDDAATDTIPVDEADARPNTVERRRFGMHESVDQYNACNRVQRNNGVFTADQNVRRRDATGTRQNPNGNRSGLECPEERDYYPHWAPNPWVDVAVLTNVEDRCDYYKAASQNTRTMGMCRAATQAILEGADAYNNREWPNNPTDCAAVAAAEGVTNDANGIWWADVAAKNTWVSDSIGEPVCGPTGESRPNHLGNSLAAANMAGTTVSTDATDAVPHTGEATRFLWTIPEHVNDACTLRLRYNISTDDYEAWGTETDTAILAAGSDATPGSTRTPLTAENNGEDSPIQQDPYVTIATDATEAETMFLSLAVNTNQYGRTFQDRSYVFAIKDRADAGIPAAANVYNLNTRGKRGNIVQTYPAVEYDMVPNDLRVTTDDYVHFQWTGSDYNPRRGCNNGEGGPPDPNDGTSAANANQNSRADRTNIIEMSESAMNWPKTAADLGTNSMFANADDRMAMAFLNQVDQLADNFGTDCLTQDELDDINNNNVRENHPRNCAKLNAAYHPYFDGGAVQMSQQGEFAYFSSRNNNFSNRDQTSYMCVANDVSTCTEGNTLPTSNVDSGSSTFVPIDDDDYLTTDTVAFQEQDNDALGDGNPSGCEELSWFPISGVTTEEAVWIAIVTLFVGMVFAVVCYKGYQRYRAPMSDGKGSKFKSKDPKSWQRPKENEMI